MASVPTDCSIILPRFASKGTVEDCVVDIRKKNFESRVAEQSAPKSGIWELPDHLLDAVGGAADFTQAAPGGGINFAQNFSCFAQNIGPYGGPSFSQGTPPST